MRWKSTQLGAAELEMEEKDDGKDHGSEMHLIGRLEFQFGEALEKWSMHKLQLSRLAWRRRTRGRRNIMEGKKSSYIRLGLEEFTKRPLSRKVSENANRNEKDF